jgi:hypothetical protein
MGGDVPLGNWFALGPIESLLWQGQRAAAIEKAEALIALANATDSPLPAGIAYRMLAQAQESFEKAEENLNESLRLLASGEARAEEARTQVVYGSLLHERGEVDAARAHWQVAADIFEAGGFENELADVRARLTGN